ncbi:MAG: DUF4055 domain-containing protein [Spirulinaceae cyanobacterium SM2_1_0]|nr:DUF4055 domain-containing protein [Spirulinaceae cyanobacterium SM2_1_0]
MDGFVGVLVDYPSIPEGLSIADLRQLNPRPYLVKVSRRSIVNWRFSDGGNQPRLELLVIKHFVNVPSGRFSTKQEARYWVLRPGLKEVYAEEVTEKQSIVWRLIERSELTVNGLPLTRIPITFYPLDTINPFGTAEEPLEPSLLDVALANFALYNRQSEHDWNLHITSLVVWLRKGLLRPGDDPRNTPMPALRIGNSAVDVPPDGDLQAIETSGAAAESRRNRIEDLRLSIMQRTLSFLSSQFGSSQMTEDEVQIRSLQTLSTLEEMGLQKQNAFGNILSDWLLWTGEDANDNYGIEFPQKCFTASTDSG